MNITDNRFLGSIELAFDDILIEPSATQIESRYQKNIDPLVVLPGLVNKTYPIFTAPMDTVVNVDCADEFQKNKIAVCLSREKKVSIEALIERSKKEYFSSLSIVQCYELFDTDIDMSLLKHPILICIDTANGHSSKLIKCVSFVRSKLGDRAIIMAGNVASVNGFIRLSDAGCDLVRVGIGFGGGCLTTQQTGIGRGMASLIRDCYLASHWNKRNTKIVADGGMKKYSDILKALALGADYVMLGSLLNRAVESASPNILDGQEVDKERAKEILRENGNLYKSFRGMSTKEVQISLGSSKIRTSEGVLKTHKVEYTLASWIDNLNSYFRSSMSYTNSKNLEEYQQNCRFRVISPAVFGAFSK